MTLLYDDNGNIIGDSNENSSRSPLSQYMGKNAGGPDQDYWYPEEKAEGPTDPEAEKLVPKFSTLNLDDVRDLPDPEWLVEKYFTTDAFGVVFGPPGSTKSFWVLDLGLCIAAGIPFNGHAVKQGHFLYAIGEGLRGLKWRIEAWLLAHPEVDEEQVRKHLHIIGEVPHLLEKQHVAMFHNTAEHIHQQHGAPLQLAAIDTWARSLVGGDENSQKDSGMAIDACERVRRLTGASVIVVHHTGADGLRERGSTALRAAADISLMVNHDESTHSTSVVMKKMKDGESGMVSRYQLRSFGRSVVLSPLDVNTPAGFHKPQPTVRDRQYYIDRAREAKNPENPF
jgi:RecA-family ATPase